MDLTLLEGELESSGADDVVGFEVNQDVLRGRGE